MFKDIDTFMKEEVKADTSLSNKQIIGVTEIVEGKQKQNPIFKHVIPEFLYRPPFGHPRNINVPFLRSISKNPYVMSIIKTLQDEASSTKWDIVPKEGVILSESDEMIRMQIKEFFMNPNDDDESFQQIIKKLITDLSVLDSGCVVKTYNRVGELLQWRVIDGGTMVKNPDMHGRIGGRDEYIFDAPNMNTSGVAYDAVGAIQQFRAQYAERAAYFQFSNTLQTSLPIPFGRKEIMYMMMNPDPSGVYSFISPVQAAVDITLNLIFGSKYNLDFYMNGNAPEGIVQLSGATSEQLNAMKDRLSNSMYTPEDEYGITRRIGYRLPITNAGDAKFIPLNFSSREMEIIAQQEWFTKILWMCFGVTATEMGFTEHSNAADENQSSVMARKAVKPLLSTIEYYFNRQIMPDLEGGDLFEFRWDEFSIDEEKKKRELQQLEITMGIKTWQMIAEEEGIDIAMLEKHKDDNMQREMGGFGLDFGGPNPSQNNDKEEIKSDLELKYKYIKRLGKPGNYTYVYRDNKTGNYIFKKREITKKTSVDRLKDIVDHIERHREPNKVLFSELRTYSDSGASVGARVKDVLSAEKKLKEQRGRFRDVGELTDLSGARVEHNDLGTTKKIVGELKEKYKVISERNYMDKPKGAYRAHHLLIEKDGTTHEVQVRTKRQGAFANYAHDNFYKPKDEDRAYVREHKGVIDSYLNELSEHLYKLDSGIKSKEPKVPEQVVKIAGSFNKFLEVYS